MLLRFISRIYLKALGWKVDTAHPPADKFICLAAPHTSGWDLPYTVAVASMLNLEFSWLGKHTLFKGVHGKIFRAIGGIPIDRRSSQNYVEVLAEEFERRDRMHLAIAAEGTRKYVEVWKSGFYHIAKEANVPIVLAYLDFGTKTGGLGPVIWPTNPKEVMDQVREFYDGIQGYHPDRFGPMKLRMEEAADAASTAGREALGEAKEALGEAKEAAAEALGEAKEAAAEALGEAKEAAAEALGGAKEAAAEALEGAAATAKEALGKKGAHA